MAGRVGDLTRERLSELAYFLNESSPSHPGDQHDPPEYWELMADYLRKKDKARFGSYTEERLADMDGMLFLEDLAKRQFLLTDLEKLLKKIKCHQALYVFEAATPPTIKCQSAANTEVIEGDSIILEVKAECRPRQPIYQWFKNQDPIVGQTQSVLLIKNASLANYGNYICRVTNPSIRGEEGIVFSKYMTVAVFSKKERTSSNPRVVQETEGGYIDGRLTISTPEIVRHPAPITAHLANTVELECSANGAAVFDWYKDDKLFRQTNRTGGKLVIENVSPKDGGMYHCVAISTQGGKATSEKARLTVDVGIKITKQPEDSVEVKVDQKFDLYCNASSDCNKELKYEWFQIQANGGHEFRGEGSEFVGKASAQRNVVWKFYCKVSLRDNPRVSKMSKIAKVKVKTVWIVAEPKGIKNYIGNRAMLYCKAEGLGPIVYRWFKSDSKDGKTKVVLLGQEYFVIDRLGQSHWGYYSCQAENDFENALSRIVRVRALLPSEATLAKQAKRTQQQPVIKIKRQPWNHVVALGARFRLLCEAVSSSDEPLHYQWHYSGKPIPNATSSELIKEKVVSSDYGSYWCLVTTKSSMQPAISTTARVEQSADPTEGRGLVSKSGNMEKMKAEMELKTLKKERFAREKVALLIGNQRYEAEQLNDLRSPEGDIRALSRDLENLGFKVISLVNLRHEEIMNALEVFYQMLAVPGIYALFYYSGHGFKIPSGRNYIVPVDAKLPLDLEHNIHVDGIIRNMQQKFSRAVVILDCCRSLIGDVIPEERYASGPLSSLEREAVLNMANYVEISSCVDNHPAEDESQSGNSLSSPTSGFPMPAHSFFNTAFRTALKKKDKISDVYQNVLKQFIDNELVNQRPQFKGSLADGFITFHDVVMMDDPREHEHLLDQVRATYDLAQVVPSDIILVGEKHLGHDLASLVKLEVSFRNEFSNVLCLVTKVVLLQNDMKTTTAKIVYDLDFIKSQFRKDDVVVEQGMCLMNSEPSEQQNAREEDEDEEEEGGQGEYESFFITSLRLFNIQRLQPLKSPKLKFFLTVTVCTEGVDKEGKVSFEVPLTTHLLNKNN